MSHEVKNEIDVSQYIYAQHEDSTQNFSIEHYTFLTIVTAVSYANIRNFAIPISIRNYICIMFLYLHFELFAFRILLRNIIITLPKYDFRRFVFEFCEL